jgi:hypothetical protein
MGIHQVSIPFDEGSDQASMIFEGSGIGEAVGSLVDSDVGVDLAVFYVKLEEVPQDQSQGGGIQLLPPVSRLRVKVKLAEPAKNAGHVSLNIFICSDLSSLDSGVVEK